MSCEDIQKGEHMKNIAYIIFLALLTIAVLAVALTTIRYTQGNPLEGGAVIIVWGIVMVVISIISINKLVRLNS